MQECSFIADLRLALGDTGERMQPDLVEHARALKAKADASTWRPIETVPRNGKPVLVYEPGHQGGIFKAHLCRMMNEKEEWIMHGNLHKLRPTLWMPLPPAPVG